VRAHPSGSRLARILDVRRVDVLLVEDDRDFRDVVEVLLSREGFRVSTADDGAEALLRLKEHHPSVLLVDLMLPRMSGEAFRAEQLASEDLASIPFVVISGREDAQAVADRLHADAFVPKPADFEEIVALVRRFTGRESTH
jgi:DNA-binding response OmpR family regulator